MAISENTNCNEIHSAAQSLPPFCFHPFLFISCVFQETRTLAEIAKAELDGTVLNNRPIRVSFAMHTAALTVRNLLPAVTNELLEEVCFKDLRFNRIGMWKIYFLCLAALYNLV